MSVTRIADRYAETLIELGQEKNKLSEVYNDVLLFQQAVHQNRDLELMLNSPIINVDKKIAILDAIFGAKTTDIFSLFLKLVCKKRRENVLMHVMKAFKASYLAINNITPVEVITAVELNDEQMNALKSAIQKLPQTRENLEIEHSIDPSILGGFRVKFDDIVYDATVSSELEAFRKRIQA